MPVLLRLQQLERYVATVLLGALLCDDECRQSVPQHTALCDIVT
jgi:hypothetical protein